ncbi:MAG: hypothetical protein QNK37_09335 [Acidobacteriota bacterium]|nr:hypothetical protein [Acidobacteriota bacterium]
MEQAFYDLIRLPENTHPLLVLLDLAYPCSPGAEKNEKRACKDTQYLKCMDVGVLKGAD